MTGETITHAYPAATVEPERELCVLGAPVDGQTVLSDARWEDRRRAWNLAVDRQPCAVARAEQAEDVISVVDAFLDDLRVSRQSPGDGAAAFSVLEDAVVVGVGRMRRIEIDATARRARMEVEISAQDGER